MDGYHATAVIRNELHINTPIIAMTAHALAGEKEKCMEHGINDYLPKPFSEADLLKKLGTWMKDEPSHSGAIPGAGKVDLAFLKKQTRNNREVMREMIDLFCQQNPIDLGALDAAIVREDFPAIVQSAHAMRNSISFFGMNESILCALLEMEALARDRRDMGSIKDRYEIVKGGCEEAIQELRTIVM